MRAPLTLAGLCLVACSEAPRMQSLGPSGDTADLAPPAAADLSGVINPVVDLVAAPPSITGISPKLLSTKGGDQLTLSGTGFSTRTSFFVNNRAADISSVAADGRQAVLILPARPGVGPAQVAVRNADGQRATNSNAVNSPTALTLSASQVMFPGRIEFQTDSSPRGVGFGDLNNDGKPDLVVANYSSNVINVFPGNGDGTFQQRSNYGTGSQPYNTVTLFDFDKDGKLDVLVPCASSNYLSFFKGNGDGSLQGSSTPGTSGTGSRPNYVATGDFNGDGNTDFVVTEESNAAIGIYLNNGNGTFQQRPYGYGTNSTPYGVAVGDVNKDGKLDIAVAHYGSSTFGIHLGQGDGQFSGQSTFNTQANPFSIKLGDFNKDGNLDVAVSNYGSYTLSIYLGNGTGSFPSRVDIPTATNPRTMEMGDINLDGIPDLVVAYYNSNVNSFGYFEGKGDGTFKRQDFSAGYAPWGINIGDVNKDGLPDIVVSGSDVSTVSVLLNQSQ
jgi:hypothetical protein